jgi:hypothetical protein
MRRMVKRLAMLPLLAVAVVSMAACTHKATTSSDEMFCIYDTGIHKGNKFVKSVPPGGVTEDTPADSEVVKIPVSNRFYNATSDASADPGAPKFYQGFTSGSIKVNVQGQNRFRFNTAGNKPCEWYAKHGRRNLNGHGDLGFNIRGDANQGWFLFLAENFGKTQQQAVNEVLGRYYWPAVVYNYPVNAGETGLVPDGQEPGELTRVKLGRELGEQFTKDLNANLGGDYFCGIDPDPNNNENACPPIRFQVTDVVTDDPKLMEDRAAFENLRQQLLNGKLATEVQKQNGAAALEAEKNRQALLEAQRNNAKTQAEIDDAKCLARAERGLDCEGHHPAPPGYYPPPQQ